MVARTRRLRTVMPMTPITMTAAAPMAMSAEMLRMILLCPKVGGREPEPESVVVLGFRTIGLGRTAGHDLFTAEPQRDGLPETE